MNYKKSFHSIFRDSSFCKRKCHRNEDCSGLDLCFNGKCQEGCIENADCPSNLKCLGGRCGYECKCQGLGKCQKCKRFEYKPEEGKGETVAKILIKKVQWLTIENQDDPINEVKDQCLTS